MMILLRKQYQVRTIPSTSFFFILIIQCEADILRETLFESIITSLIVMNLQMSYGTLSHYEYQLTCNSS